MMADSGGRTTSRRPRRRGFPRRASRLRCFGAGVAGLALASTALAACGSSGGSGPVTINYYVFNDVSGSFATAVSNCSKASGGKYTIVWNKLPAAADDQRLQLVRRLAAADPSMDILGLDVTWAPEFAEPGGTLPCPGPEKREVGGAPLKSPLKPPPGKENFNPPPP